MTHRIQGPRSQKRGSEMEIASWEQNIILSHLWGQEGARAVLNIWLYHWSQYCMVGYMAVACNMQRECISSSVIAVAKSLTETAQRGKICGNSKLQGFLICCSREDMVGRKHLTAAGANGGRCSSRASGMLGKSSTSKLCRQPYLLSFTFPSRCLWPWAFESAVGRGLWVHLL